VFAKDAATASKLVEIVQNHFLFAHLAPAELGAIVEVMTPVDCAVGDAIIRQGDKGDAFYLVTDGLFDIHVDGVGRVAQDLGCGKSFGELALLYNAPRNASVIASVPSKAWAIDRATFRAAMAVRSRETQAEVRSQLSSAPLLKHLTNSQLGKVADAIKYQTFAAGDIIINKGEVGNAFYLIKKGSVLCTDIGTSSVAIADVPLDAGTYFGERSLLRDEPRAATIVATTDVDVMVLDRIAFQNLLGPLEEVMNFNHFMRMLRSVPALQDLPDAKLEDVIEECDKIVCSAPGEVVARQTDPPEDMFLVVAGTVNFQPPVGASLKTVAEGEHFTGAALAGFDRSGITAVASDNTTVWRVSARVIASAVSAAAGGAGGGAGGAGPSSKARPVCTIELGDLDQLATLGMGTFGRVRLVKHKKTGEVYALKMMQKALVVEHGQTKAVVAEKEILIEISHPFILSLYTTYQDAHKLYMLLEIVPGGELFGLQGEQPDARFQPDWARFYAACVEDALSYMHSYNILYRDLKPENLLIDKEGFIKVVDFGFAKRIPLVSGWCLSWESFAPFSTPFFLTFFNLSPSFLPFLPFFALYYYVRTTTYYYYHRAIARSRFAVHPTTSRQSCCSGRATARVSTFGRLVSFATRCCAGTPPSLPTIRIRSLFARGL
jgi:cGMP-dependent protein kinase|tara:strand:+ start:150 stop:2135 length:1986 start_codon:yes stop_codon:yes gene_type:complete